MLKGCKIEKFIFCSMRIKQDFIQSLPERIHTDESPFLCNICSLSFSRSGTRNEHEKIVHGFSRLQETVNEAGSGTMVPADTVMIRQDGIEIDSSDRVVTEEDCESCVPITINNVTTTTLPSDTALPEQVEPPQEPENEANNQADEPDTQESGPSALEEAILLDHTYAKIPLNGWATAFKLRQQELSQSIPVESAKVILTNANFETAVKLIDQTYSSECEEGFKLEQQLQQRENLGINWPGGTILLENPPYICRICDGVFSNEDLLNLHSLYHTNPDRLKYKCDQCDFSSATGAGLKIHKRCHGSDPPSGATVASVSAVEAFPVAVYTVVLLPPTIVVSVPPQEQVLTAEAFQHPTETFQNPTEAFQIPAEAFQNPTEAFQNPTEAFQNPTEAFQNLTEAFQNPGEASQNPGEATQNLSEAFQYPAAASIKVFSAATASSTINAVEALTDIDPAVSTNNGSTAFKPEQPLQFCNAFNSRPEGLTVVPEIALHVCRVCSAAFTEEILLTHHYIDHLEDLLYKCDQCCFLSGSFSCFKMHKTVHASPRLSNTAVVTLKSAVKSNEIPDSKKRCIEIKNSGQISAHGASQLAQRNAFACKHCGAKFQEKIHAKGHMKMCSARYDMEHQSPSNFQVNQSSSESKGSAFGEAVSAARVSRDQNMPPVLSAPQPVQPWNGRESKTPPPILEPQIPLDQAQQPSIIASHVNNEEPKHSREHRKNFGNLYPHMLKRLLTGDQPFSCPTCHKGFFSEENLERHECSIGPPLLRAIKKEKVDEDDDGDGEFLVWMSQEGRKEPKIIKSQQNPAAKIRKKYKSTPLICRFCTYLTTRFAYLKAHESIHTGEQHFSCNTCGFRGRNPGRIFEHQRRNQCKRSTTLSNSPEVVSARSSTTITTGNPKKNCGKAKHRRFACEICSKTFIRRSYLKVHSYIHTGEKPYTCNKCNYRTHQPSCLHWHKQKGCNSSIKSSKLKSLRPEKAKLYRCGYCPKESATRMHLRLHLRQHLKARSYSCRGCGAQFKNPQQVVKHKPHCTRSLLPKPTVAQTVVIKTEPPDVQISEAETEPSEAQTVVVKTEPQEAQTVVIKTEPLEAEACTSREAKYIQSLFANSLKQPSKRGRKSVAKPGIDLYIKFDPENWLNQFGCKLCNKTFLTRTNARSHVVRIHLSQNKCDVCGQGFVLLSELVDHFPKHVDKKPYDCPQCPVRFSDLNAREMHIAGHSCNDPFLCLLCGEWFRYDLSLKEHAKMHVSKA